MSLRSCRSCGDSSITWYARAGRDDTLRRVSPSYLCRGLRSRADWGGRQPLLLVILQIRVHRPEIMVGTLQVLDCEHRSQHRVVLIVVFMHSVPSYGDQVRHRFEMTANHVDALAIGGIV